MYQAKFDSLLFEDGKALLGVSYEPDDRSHDPIPETLDITGLDETKVFDKVDARLKELSANGGALKKVAEHVGRKEGIRPRPEAPKTDDAKPKAKAKLLEAPKGVEPKDEQPKS